MNRLLITTVGTSLLTNRDDRPWAPWDRKTRQLPADDVVDKWLSTADPVIASAELNTLNSISICTDDCVRLLHSDTEEGRFCSAGLKKWSSSRVRFVDEVEISGLTYSHDAFGRAGTGLKNLIAKALDAVKHAKQQSLTPVFCATGGFKAEIAFLNLLGALLGIEVVYIHEQFRELVVLPKLPITWNADFARDNSSFFEWIDTEPRPGIEVEKRLNANPELRSLVVHADDGNAYLDAAGELFWQAAKLHVTAAPRALWPTADPKHPAQKNGVSSISHHRPVGWESFVSKLASIDCVSRISYDAAAHGPHRIKILDAAQGTIGVTFGTTNPLPLRVETTAKGAAQTDLVAEHLKKLR